MCQADLCCIAKVDSSMHSKFHKVSLYESKEDHVDSVKSILCTAMGYVSFRRQWLWNDDDSWDTTKKGMGFPFILCFLAWRVTSSFDGKMIYRCSPRSGKATSLTFIQVNVEPSTISYFCLFGLEEEKPIYTLLLILCPHQWGLELYILACVSSNQEVLLAMVCLWVFRILGLVYCGVDPKWA